MAQSSPFPDPNEVRFAYPLLNYNEKDNKYVLAPTPQKVAPGFAYATGAAYYTTQGQRGVQCFQADALPSVSYRPRYRTRAIALDAPSQAVQVYSPPASQEITTALHSLERRVDNLRAEVRPHKTSFGKKMLLTLGLAFLSASTVRYWMNKAEPMFEQSSTAASRAPLKPMPINLTHEAPVHPLLTGVRPYDAATALADVDRILHGAR